MLNEIQKLEIEKINKMSQYEMCKLWRYAPLDHPYFDSSLPYFKVFEERLFNYFSGFSSEISKAIDV